MSARVAAWSQSCSYIGERHTFSNRGVRKNMLAALRSRLRTCFRSQATFIGCASRSLSTASAEYDLWTWGDGRAGALGNGSAAQQMEPGLVRLTASSSDTKVLISSGLFHSLAIAGGELFSFGRGDAGRLGHGNEEGEFSPRRVDFFSGVQLLDTTVESSTSEIVMCSAGGLHSAAITAKGELYSWGYGGWGQLGHGGHFRCLYPERVELPTTDESGLVKGVACGGAHTLIVSESGTLYSCGRGEHGRLGLGNSNDSYSLKQVIGKTRERVVSSVACGGFHSACLTDEGVVYTWGGGVNGELGHGKRLSLLKPKRLRVEETLDSPDKAVSVSCGGFHTAVHMESGRLLMFGQGDAGQIGDGEMKRHVSPHVYERIDGGRILDVSCGALHTVAIVEHSPGENAVYHWGKRPEDMEKNSVPTRVSLPSDVNPISVSAGGSHTGIVTVR